MTAAAPRLDHRLLRQLDDLARTSDSAAEIRRKLATSARNLGIPPPSYEHVRRLVARRRDGLQAASGYLPIALEVGIGARHGSDLVRAMSGETVRRERRK
jgi:hypothetical protein